MAHVPERFEVLLSPKDVVTIAATETTITFEV